MTTTLWIVFVVLALLAGGGIGFYVSQRYTKRYLEQNPPVNEKMIRLMFQQMGRKPSEKQVRQIMQSMGVKK